jgi:hypothetical protein
LDRRPPDLTGTDAGHGVRPVRRVGLRVLGEQGDPIGEGALSREHPAVFDGRHIEVDPDAGGVGGGADDTSSSSAHPQPMSRTILSPLWPGTVRAWQLGPATAVS